MPVPLHESRHRAPVTADVLAIALRRRDELAPGAAARPSGGYHFDPTDAEQAQGLYDCTTFIAAILEDAGFDMDRSVRVAGVPATVRELVMIEVVLFGPGYRGARDLEIRVGEDDPRVMGVVAALVASAQGAQIRALDDLRPGDLVQTWRRYTRRGTSVLQGHVTVVHTVEAQEPSGAAKSLDERSPPGPGPLLVHGVGLLGAHLPTATEPASVHTRPADDLRRLDRSRRERWYAVRPFSSRWGPADRHAEWDPATAPFVEDRGTIG